jgi:uncharacterized protein (TIGR02270 family)
VASSDPRAARIGLCAQIQLRRAEPVQLLQLASSGDDPDRQSLATLGLGIVGDTSAVNVLRRFLGCGEPLEYAAAWSLARLARDEAAGTILSLPLPAASAWIEQLSQGPESLERAVQAAGALGDPRWLDWLLDRMSDPSLARLAGESFSNVTGLDLARDGLEAEAPAGFPSGPDDDPRHDDVAPDPWERLPWPDRSKLAKWLDRHRHSFPPGERFFLGAPLDDMHFERHLREGTQRQRAAAALELAVRHPATPLVNVALHAERQRERLAFPTYRRA